MGSDHGATSPIMKAVDQGLLDQPISTYFQPLWSDEIDYVGLNSDSEHYNFTWHNLPNWSHQYISQIAEALGAAGAAEDFKIDCDADSEPLILTIGGKEYALSTKSLMLEQESSHCILALDVDEDWILGDTSFDHIAKFMTLAEKD
uniref:Peptidase A1 domain-containing protein n=1 Tax=Ditylenchus dipsaci TaxID=166011 RepID=A0A915DK21_9BILA